MAQSLKSLADLPDSFLHDGRGVYDAITAENQTILHLACEEGHLELVATLLSLRADPNIVNDKGQTALQAACKSGEDEIV